ncbi:MAG: hypothetical protein D3924_20445, partial [Candidatus Electrothrix sp. AR4]|nr:hypothetical protein [Candidatus Electrothrix sp. AR4]
MLKTCPPVTVIPLTAVRPSLQDNTADLDRLKTALTASLSRKMGTYRPRIPFDCMAKVATGFRNAGFSG